MSTKTIGALTVALLLAGCVEDTPRSVELYRCSGAQLELVKTETAICTQTGYLPSYCFEQAKKTQCEHIKPKGGEVKNPTY